MYGFSTSGVRLTWDQKEGEEILPPGAHRTDIAQRGGVDDCWIKWLY